MIMQRKRGGFTLTEIAIVLGIVGTILGAIWGAMAKVSSNRRAAKTAEQILLIASGVRNMYTNRGQIDSGDLTTTAVGFGVFPEDMLRSSLPYSLWNGRVYVGGYDSNYTGASGDTGTQTQMWHVYYAGDIDNAPGVVGQVLGGAASSGLTAIKCTGDGGAKATAVTTGTAFSTFKNCTGDLIFAFEL